MMNLSQLNIKFVKNAVKLNVMKNTNIYKITFFFDDDWWYTDMTANQLATYALNNSFGDSIHDLYEEQNDDYFEFKFTSNGKKYFAVYSIGNVSKLNIYNDDEEGTIVEKNIPYLVIKVENSGNIIYNLGNEI